VLAGRGFVLFPAAVYAIHQLRFELGYGSGSDAALAAQGHGYLDSLAPWLALLLALGFGSFLARLIGAASGRPDSRPRRSLAGLAAVASALLCLSYVAQEWLEGAFAAGHPAGFAGVFGHGGWWAVPLSALAGVAVAALLRLATTAVEAVSRPSAQTALVPGITLLRPASAPVIVLSPLARRLAGRAPPGT
jgi:dolichol kinase